MISVFLPYWIIIVHYFLNVSISFFSLFSLFLWSQLNICFLFFVFFTTSHMPLYPFHFSSILVFSMCQFICSLSVYPFSLLILHCTISKFFLNPMIEFYIEYCIFVLCKYLILLFRICFKIKLIFFIFPPDISLFSLKSCLMTLCGIHVCYFYC